MPEAVVEQVPVGIVSHAFRGLGQVGVLCQGEIKVLRELKMEGSSRSVWSGMKQKLFGLR